MSEIKNPDQQIDNPLKDKSPEELQAKQATDKRLGQEIETSDLEDLKKTPEGVSDGPKKEGSQKETDEKRIDDDLKRMDIPPGGDAGDGGGPPDPPDPKNEIGKSKFEASNFSAENSYDAHASQEVRELAAKANSELVPMGEPIPEERVAKEPYSQEDVLALKAEREKVDVPTENTVMQKVIGVDTGDFNKDLSLYLNPTDKTTGEPKNADVMGFVAKAEDVTPFTRTPQACYDNARLDYTGTKFKDPDQPVYVLRFTDGTNYEVPYNAEFGGHCKEGQPCAGNGYLAGDKHMIPEFKVVTDDKGRGAIITDGAIYRLYPDGHEVLVARFNEDTQKFEECKKKEGKQQ